MLRLIGSFFVVVQIYWQQDVTYGITMSAVQLFYYVVRCVYAKVLKYTLLCNKKYLKRK
ncbi:hypothetical protein CLV62_101291 [Dysgonomonas alginatilytica]|uniref:Uncharacterized protein n=1 Tax=Dysgonomonas alginatilytica TaxID=1605892 RepID=A0A2V3PW53_9BACT|nr:hypothetical protein CLV62_101291 [Dysgonomonas alginatilytica]